MMEILCHWLKGLEFLRPRSKYSIPSFPNLSDMKHKIEQAEELLTISKDECPLDNDGTNIIEDKDSKSKICECFNCVILPTLTECGVCFEPLQGYGIQSCYICSNLICGTCASRLMSCAFCRTGLPMERNRAIERLLDKLILPCKNWRYGCDVHLSAENRFDHEEICNFSLIKCPCDFGNCHWRGAVDEIESHMTNVHQLEVLQDFGVSVEIRDFRKKAERLDTHYSICLSYYDQLFYANIVISNGKLKVSVIKLGYIKKLSVPSPLPKYAVTIKLSGSCKSMKGILPFEKNLYDTREIVIKRKRLYFNKKDNDGEDLVIIHLCVTETNNSS